MRRRREGIGALVGLRIKQLFVPVLRLEWHVHPRVTGPSDSDREVLKLLRQNRSRLYEIGGGDSPKWFGKDKS